MNAMKTLEVQDMAAADYAQEPRKASMPSRAKTDYQEVSHVSGTTLMMATAGGASGAAFLGGALLGSPWGAVGGMLVGIGLGLLLRKAQGE